MVMSSEVVQQKVLYYCINSSEVHSASVVLISGLEHLMQPTHCGGNSVKLEAQNLLDLRGDSIYTVFWYVYVCVWFCFYFILVHLYKLSLK